MRFPLEFRSSFAVVIAVLCALAPSPARAASGPAAPSFVFPTCGTSVEHTLGVDTVSVLADAGVIQPVGAPGNLASITPKLSAAYLSRASVEVVEWNPLALIPDAGAVALRTRTFDASAVQYGWTQFSFDPPIVTRGVPHLAEPLSPGVAYRWRNVVYFSGPSNPQFFEVDRDGPANVPTGFKFTAPGSPYIPLTGPHPIVDHTLCLGDDALQSLVVAQCVRTADRTVNSGTETLLQRFRVTVPVRLRWVELSLGALSNGYPYTPGTISLYDSDGSSAPPSVDATPLVQADFSTSVDGIPQWRSHADFDRLIVLEPNHEYWLGVITRGACVLNAKTLDGSQSVDFAAQIGPLYRRALPEDPWLPIDATALDFRIIGEPVDLTDAPATVPRTLAMRLSPNPSRGDVTIGWSGAVGRVRIEVIDARGRRVGGDDVEASAAGRWTWRAVDSRGGALPAGVYFVRATDGAGHAGAERVVLVR